jgi:hypothetical protein
MAPDGCHVFDIDGGLRKIDCNLDNFIEYKTPITHVRYVHWLRDKQTQKVFMAVTDMSHGWTPWQNGHDHLKTDKIEYVEHSE